jgi:hypothetical protein
MADVFTAEVVENLELVVEPVLSILFPEDPSVQ